MDTQDFYVLRDQLKRDEGLRLFPYQDTRGKISIGYGRNLTDNGITQLEADDMLSQDITRHWTDVISRYPFVESLDAARQIALGNMCFNLGISALSKFTVMWLALEHGDFQKAAAAMLDSEWAKQVGARATRLAATMASGELK